ncbi:MAG: hypothetical protein HC831_29995 [Chloroflexia bacterium]|nr:hypothetical protein [Chloroflexia bacterium]
MEKGIFTVVFTGDILFDSIISYLDDFKNMQGLPKNLKLLYNFTNANFHLDPVKIKIISDKATDVTSNYTSIRTAFVVAEPKVTAYSMLFSLMNNTEKTSREIFSTLSAAIDWLNGHR